MKELSLQGFLHLQATTKFLVNVKTILVNVEACNDNWLANDNFI